MADAKGPGPTIQSAAGFVMIANRVLEALLGAPFSGTQLRVLLAIFRLTYGWRRISVKVTASDLARFAGIGIGNDVTRPGGTFRKELASLIREGVVLAPDATKGVKTVTLGIQSDPAKWGRYSVSDTRLAAIWDVRHVHNDALIRDAQSDSPNENRAGSGANKSPEKDDTGDGETGQESGGNDDVTPPSQVAQVEANSPPPSLASEQATLEERWPGIGPDLARYQATAGPVSGHVLDVSGSNSNELDPRKDIEIQEIQTTTTTTADDDPKIEDPKTPSPESVYTLGITVAANRAIEAKWGEQIHPLYYGASSQLAADLMTDGVPLDVAQSSIIAQVKASKNPEPPSSINYFRRGILQAAKSDEQRALDRSDIPVAEGVSARGGKPTSIAYVVTPQSDRDDYDMDKHYEAERDRAARAWFEDPANRLQVAAISAKAEADNAIIAGTKMGDRAIARDVLIACGIAAGFPAREVWKAARNVPRGAVENSVDSVEN